MGLPMDKSYLLTQLRNFKSIILDPAYIIQKTTLPTATVDLEGVVYQYIGNSSSLTLGGFYQCQSDGAVSPTYSWVEIPVKIDTDGTTVLKNSNGELYVPTATASALGLVKAGDGTAMNNGALDVVDRIKMVSLMPTASASLVGTAVMFLGTAGTYTRGSIYECVSDGESTPTYSWEILLNADNTAEIEVLTNQVKDMNNVYGSKNLLPFNLVDIVAKNTNGTWSDNKYTVSGVTYTFNADGTITINGTRTTAGGVTISEFSLEAGEKYKYSIGNPFNLSNTAGSNIQGYDGTTWVALGNIFGTETEAEFESNSTYSKYRVNINSNNGVTFSNLTIKPMIRLASITDDTYEPYAKTNQQLTKDTTGLLDNTKVNGAVNILPNNATSQVNNGITFIVNDDGTITCNGTATGESSIIISTKLKKGTYRFSGVPKTGSYSSYWSYYQKDGVTQANDFGDGLVFSLNSEATITCVFRIKSGYTASDLTFKPMITVASYNGDYVPYAKSNKELTEDVDSMYSELLARGFLGRPGQSQVIADIDQFRQNGFFRTKIDNVDHYGIAMCFNADWVLQIATQTRGTDIKFRIRNNGPWTSWKTISTVSTV